MIKRNVHLQRRFTPSLQPKPHFHRRRLRFEPLADRRLLTTLTVNTLSDAKLAGDGLVTLREAILAANTNTATDLEQSGSADTIVFAPDSAGNTQMENAIAVVRDACQRWACGTWDEERV